MYAKPDLRVLLEWAITGSGSAILKIGQSIESYRHKQEQDLASWDVANSS